MRTLLHYVAIADNQDKVRVLDGGQPMRDHERGAPGHKVVHGLLDALLGARVHRARGLVEDEHAPVGQDGARDGEQLALTLADVTGVLIDLGVVAVGQRLDEVVDVGRSTSITRAILRSCFWP